MPDWWHEKLKELRNAVNRLDFGVDFMSDIDLFILTTDVVNIAQYLQGSCGNRIEAAQPPRLGLDD